MSADKALSALWFAAAACLLIGAARYASAARTLAATVPEPLVVDAVAPPWPSRDSLLKSAKRVVAASAFSAPGSQTGQASQAGAPRPMSLPPIQPVLRGLVGGPPWTAVVQGLPNTSGAVVLRTGDTVSGFSIARVRGDTVLLRGPSATYTLTRQSP